MGRTFRRVVINDDGSGEVEYKARNPWESLVIPLIDLTEPLCLSAQGSKNRRFLKGAVIRKKCTKCFLHQREAMTTDL